MGQDARLGVDVAGGGGRRADAVRPGEIGSRVPPRRHGGGPRSAPRADDEDGSGGGAAGPVGAGSLTRPRQSAEHRFRRERAGEAQPQAAGEPAQVDAAHGPDGEPWRTGISPYRNTRDADADAKATMAAQLTSGSRRVPTGSKRRSTSTRLRSKR